MTTVHILAALCALLALTTAVLTLRLTFIRRAAEELRQGMEDWMLMGDTNTLISTTSGERCMRRLAAGLNAHLRALRAERRRLQNGSDELGDAITNVSHDLRTPLTAILGYLELLEREELSPAARRHVAVIRERAEAMKALVEELFRFSVIGAEGELRLESVNLNAALEEALAAAYSALQGRDIALEVRMPENPVERKLNRAALGRVLGNILSNAAKYSGGDLVICLDEAGTLRFSNEAPALDELQVGRLFDRFYTVESARGSTGLGLSIARALTERMNGAICAEYANGRLCVQLEFPDAAGGPRDGC